MPALTINDMNNGSQDLAYVAQVATSLEKTATDRLGKTRLTLAGAIDTVKAFNYRGDWSAATLYKTKDLIAVSDIVYLVLIEHVSTSVAVDFAAGRIIIYQGVVMSDLGSLAAQDAAAVDVTGGVIGGVSMNGARNNEATKFPKWIAALARARAGGAMAKIALIGDSMTSGVGSNPLSASTDSRRRAYPQRLAEALTAGFNLQAQANSIWCDGSEASNITQFDPRLALEPGWSISTAFVVGGFAFLDDSIVSPRMRFSPTGMTDTLDVYFVKYPGYAEVVVSTDGIFHGSAFTGGPQGIGKMTVTREASNRPWDIQKSTSTPAVRLQIVGMDAYLSTLHNVSVWNMGASGSRVRHWVEGGEPYNFRNALPQIGPDISVICLTINDWAAATPAASYKSDLQTMIDAASVTGDVALMVGVPSNEGVAPIPAQDAIAAYMHEVANASNRPTLDLRYRWVSQSYMPMRGFYFDGPHPSNVGCCDIAQFVSRVIGNP